MHRNLLLVLISLGALLAFVMYCVALTDWIQDYSSGLYSHHTMEALIETGALLMYTYFGVRFFNRTVNASR